MQPSSSAAHAVFSGPGDPLQHFFCPFAPKGPMDVQELPLAQSNGVLFGIDESHRGCL